MSAPATLVGHLALLSAISFGGMPGVLPDLHHYVVNAHNWIGDQDFANCFAVVQAIPGPNMVLLVSFIGWQIGGLPTAIASALAIFVPSCTIAYIAFHFWHRFQETGWQRRLRRGLTPVTIGLMVAGGTVMAQSGDATWPAVAVTAGAAALLLGTKINPILLIAAGGALGACGLL